jgi:hypothetical protein
LQSPIDRGNCSFFVAETGFESPRDSPVKERYIAGKNKDKMACRAKRAKGRQGPTLNLIIWVKPVTIERTATQNSGFPTGFP